METPTTKIERPCEALGPPPEYGRCGAVTPVGHSRCVECQAEAERLRVKMWADTAARADEAVGEIVASARLPARFYDDHADRGCPSGRVTRRLARSVDVDLDQAAIDDLYSDAEHYASINEYDPAMRSAARSMIAALERNGLF